MHCSREPPSLRVQTHSNARLDVQVSQYVSEAVAAIAEASLRPSDIPAAVKVCSALHRRYPDFSSQIAAALAKVGSGHSPPPVGSGSHQRVSSIPPEDMLACVGFGGSGGSCFAWRLAVFGCMPWEDLWIVPGSVFKSAWVTLVLTAGDFEASQVVLVLGLQYCSMT